jgi:uncharacterized membrane protein YesL
MPTRKDFGEGTVFTISNYVWWFLLSNIYFLLVNIPFIFICLISAQTVAPGINLILIICSLSVGPALVALFSVMGKLIREKDLNVTKDFFIAYKKNFLEAIFVWTIIVLMLSVLYIDITAIMVGPVFNIILLAIGFIIISLTFYILPIISRFYLRKRDVLKLAFIYSIKKIHLTILNWVLLIGLFMLLGKVSTLMFLFMWSIFGYMVMFFQRGILKELEEKIANQKQSNIQV